MFNVNQPDSGQINFVMGPTGAGKSKWALKQAEEKNGIIVNVDSIQFYKDLDIGSAKPTTEDRNRVRHYLFDIVEPFEQFTAGDFVRGAREIINQHIATKNIFFVGGSGFYFQALEKGMFEVPPIPETIKKQVELIQMTKDLYEMLRELDAQTAEKLSRNDSYRVRRALEVKLATGKSMLQLEHEFRLKYQGLAKEFPLKKFGIFCDRDLLRIRIKNRVKQMLGLGLLEEVRTLLSKGYRDTKALASVGYKECVTYLEHAQSEDELLASIVQSTMQLAKRQMTWFKRDREICWIDSNSGCEINLMRKS